MGILKSSGNIFKNYEVTQLFYFEGI